MLNQGRIVEQGTHEQLIEAKSYYYDLVKNQMHAEEVHSEEIIESPGKLVKN